MAEEIEALAKSDKREILSRLAIMCEHLLNGQFQHEARSNGWRSSVRQGRSKIAALTKESPTLLLAR